MLQYPSPPFSTFKGTLTFFKRLAPVLGRLGKNSNIQFLINFSLVRINHHLSCPIYIAPDLSRRRSSFTIFRRHFGHSIGSDSQSISLAISLKYSTYTTHPSFRITQPHNTKVSHHSRKSPSIHIDSQRPDSPSLPSYPY